MAERLKVKFLTAIWGARYIQEFARLSLPACLAAGNLPYLASETDLEILIMTSHDGLEIFNEEPIFARVALLCPIRYILIDDLITSGVYGVTLTLAYARGIRDSGPEQTNTTFIFMNSDFVLADGAMRTLVAKLYAGARCVMAPSLRASAEPTLPMLTQAINPATGVLSMPPRRMVQLALDNLHPTVIGKTVSQQFVTSSIHNQIYWQVDNNTLLARYYLIFMLAIRSERPLGQINSYCDYGLVPEMVPSGRFDILDDSDEFFMLELQPEAQERHFLYSGSPTPVGIARQLSAWSTREHRRFAERDVIFRSGDLPPGLATARAQLSEYAAAVNRCLRRPMDHVRHFYWTSGVQIWIALKFADGADEVVLPPELDTGSPAISRILAQCRSAARLISYRMRNRDRPPAIPDVPLWHHLWLDSQLIIKLVKSIKERGYDRNLLLCDRRSPLPRTLAGLLPCDVWTGVEAFLETADGEQPDNVVPGAAYDNVIVHLYRANVRLARRVFETAQARIRPGGRIAIFIEHLNGEADGSNFSSELAQYLGDVLPEDWMQQREEAIFAGGYVRRRLRRAELLALRYLWPASVQKIALFPAALVLWPVLVTLTALNNLRCRKVSSYCPRYCSSALLSLTRPRDAAAVGRRETTTLGVAPGAALPAAGSRSALPVGQDGD